MHPVDDGPHLADSNDLNLMVFDTTIFKQVLDSMAIGHWRLDIRDDDQNHWFPNGRWSTNVFLQ